MSRKQPLKVEFGTIKRAKYAVILGLVTMISAGADPKMQVAQASTKVNTLTIATTNSLDGEETITKPEPTPLELRALDYIRFRQDITEIEAMPFDNEGITRNAHRRLGAHESWSLSSAWMAYAALIAADTPGFAEAMQAELRGENDIPTEKKKKRKKKKKKSTEMDEAELVAAKAKFLAKLSANPRYPRTMPGADKAITAIMEMALNDSLRMSSLGENFKSQAYSMQKTRWGKRRLSSAQTRLGEAESYRNSRPGMAIPQFARTNIQGVTQPGVATSDAYNWSTAWGYPSSISYSHASGSTAIMDRILNLAARYAVGSVNDRVVAAYAKNNKSEQCLSISKLTLNQCIAATRTPYEEAFCLGEHALIDIADCLGWIAAP